MTNQALVVDDQPTTLSTTLSWTQEDLNALRDTIAKDCNDAQFRVFLAACRRLNLDPFARQIVPIVQGGRMTPQVTIDGFRLIAERTGKYAGQVGPFWCGPDGKWVDVWLDDKPPVASKVGILRRDFAEPIWGVARYKAYAKGNLWNTMGDVMTAKVAESLGFRKSFPIQLGGVYTDDELQGEPESQAQSQHPVESRASRATSAHVEQTQSDRQETARTSAPKNGRPYNPLADVLLRRELKRRGINTIAEVEEWVADACRGAEATQELMEAYLDYLDTQAREADEIEFVEAEADE